MPDIGGHEQENDAFGKYAARTRAAERRQNELKQKRQRTDDNPFAEQLSEQQEAPHPLELSSRSGNNSTRQLSTKFYSPIRRARTRLTKICQGTLKVQLQAQSTTLSA